MSTLIIGPAPHVVKPQSPAARLSPEERKGLAVKVLARTDPVTALAEQNGVSRKFLYVQATKAKEALQDAFDPASNEGDSRVLFYIPVTKQWLVQLVLALVLICRSSIRGVCEFFGAILDSKTSIGTALQRSRESGHFGSPESGQSRDAFFRCTECSCAVSPLRSTLMEGMG